MIRSKIDLKTLLNTEIHLAEVGLISTEISMGECDCCSVKLLWVVNRLEKHYIRTGYLRYNPTYSITSAKFFKSHHAKQRALNPLVTAALNCLISQKHTHHHFKVLKGNMILSFPLGSPDSVYSWKWFLGPVSVVNNTYYFMLPHTERKCINSLWSLCVSRAMKNSLRRPGVSSATGRQLFAWLPTPFLFHYFTPHLEWRLKVSQWAVISLRRLASACPTTDSEPNKPLTFWQIPRLLFFYQCYCIFPTFGCRLSVVTAV